MKKIVVYITGLTSILFGVAGCAKQVVTKTTTVNHTVTQKVPGPAKRVVHAPAPPPRTVTVIKEPPQPEPRHGLAPPPAGVFQVGDKMFLIRPGYEANMHYLCKGGLDIGRNAVAFVKEIDGDFFVQCTNSVGRRYADLPFTPTPVPVAPVTGPLRVPDLSSRRWMRQGASGQDGH